VEDVEIGGGWRVVTPPWDEDVMIGIWCPLGESGLTAVVGGPLPRRALGI
jgi:hypothetical protein